MTVYITQPARNIREELAATPRASGLKTLGGRALVGQGELLAAAITGGLIYLSAAGVPITNSLLQFDGSKLAVGAATPRGKFSVGSINAGGMTSVTTWDDRYTIFGPNVASVNGAALGLGYNTTDDAANIIALSPGFAWKPLRIGCSAFSVLGAGANQGLYQDGSGNVAIGATTASAKLHVKGGNGNTLRLDNDGSNTTELDLRNNGTQKAGLTFYAPTSELTLLNYANGPIEFYANGAERARISAAGGLSVGTTADAGAGNIRATGVIRSGTFTVATLPSASASGSGASAYVSDASAPAFGADVVGGGAVGVGVRSNGSTWKVG